MKLPDERIAELKAAEAAATDGPWEGDGFPDGEIHADIKGYPCVCYQVCSGAKDERDTGEDNAAFIATSRTAIPDLLADREALTAEIAVLRGKLNDMAHESANIAMERDYEMSRVWKATTRAEKAEAKNRTMRENAEAILEVTKEVHGDDCEGPPDGGSCVFCDIDSLARAIIADRKDNPR